MLCYLAAVLAAYVPPARGGGFEWKNGRWVRAPKAGKGTPAAELEAIRRLLANKDRRRAVKAAEDFLDRYGDHELREDAMMLAGQAEFDRERYYQAYEWFEKLLSEFPQGKLSDRALDREYRVGDAFLRGKKRIVGKVFRLPAEDEGVEILTRVAEHAPGTALAAKALLRIGDHFFDKAKYEEAAKRYDQFLELFPKSRRASYAMLRAARATYAAYKGPGFDETPLLDALQRFRRFNELYPRLAERERIPPLLERITNQQAERLYKTAEFYRRTRHSQAAQFYLKRLIERYPKTQWARRARVQMSQPNRSRPSVGRWIKNVLSKPRAKPKPKAEPKPKAVIPATTERSEGWE